MLYNIVLVSAIYQHESAIGIHTSPSFWTSLSSPQFRSFKESLWNLICLKLAQIIFMDSWIWKSLAYSMEHCLAFSKCSQCFFVLKAESLWEVTWTGSSLPTSFFSSFLCFSMLYQFPDKTSIRCILSVFAHNHNRIK